MFHKKGILALAVCLALQTNFVSAFSISGQEEMEFGNKLGKFYNEEVSDWLSDEYGFCHAGFELKAK